MRTSVLWAGMLCIALVGRARADIPLSESETRQCISFLASIESSDRGAEEAGAELKRLDAESRDLEAEIARIAMSMGDRPSKDDANYYKSLLLQRADITKWREEAGARLRKHTSKREESVRLYNMNCVGKLMDDDALRDACREPEYSSVSVCEGLMP